MKEMLMKKRSEKGFTLMELLIVVAIIVILVAISIPIFNAQLEKSREATDIANMRAAKAAAVTEYLAGTNAGKAATYNYDAQNGKLVASTTTPTGYGKGTTVNGGQSYADYVNTTDYTDKYITVTISASGDVTLDWAASA